MVAHGSSSYFSLDLFSDENKYTNDIFLQNNLVVHETPLSVTSQTEPIVQKALSIKVNSSLDETKGDCGHHNLEACCELLNEITKLTCLCTSQKDIDLLFEELYKSKAKIAENITTEYRILLRPDNNSDA